MSSAWSARGADYVVSSLHRQGPSLAKLLALARPQTNDLCLDIGTGAGHTAQLVSRGGRNVKLEVNEPLLWQHLEEIHGT